MDPHDITLFVYNIALLPIVFFSVLFILLALIRLVLPVKTQTRYRRVADSDLPFVSVQIPTFNDPIAERCVQKCLGFDYPKDRYEIIIVDDSTNVVTQSMLARYSEKYPDQVKYVHRKNRSGFKPGALRNAMKVTKGEILVIFDSDWIPHRSFLRHVVGPFSDENVALVQTRQGFYNKHTNLITRFASYLLMVYHAIVMPINNKINCVFFCGTAGALRRKSFEDVGGWNAHSITEDADLTVKMLLKGYKTVYLDIETPSEVPDTFESFLKQQMRWCYGNVRVFCDNAFKILFGRGISVWQRLMILFVTMGNVAAPIVLIMTIFGFAGWFSGEPTLFTLSDVSTFFLRIGYTAGFLVMGAIALYTRKELREFPQMVLSAVSIGLVLAFGNSYAFFKAILNRPLKWFCTPKVGNSSVVSK